MPVVYQIYPRSFQDSDGDGVGDLRGITSRLDHLAWLGVDALWMSPISPSPMRDGGYDVSDYDGVHPLLGTDADADALIDAAHARGIKVLLDFVPCHTSVDHAWFRDHPERYTWSPVDGPANNWASTFGGPAWSPDPHGRGWFLHSFYPEQADLDWRHPDVAPAVGAAMGRWRERGVDGFRLDALERLYKDPLLRDDGWVTTGSDGAALPSVHPDFAALDHVHSLAQADVGQAVSQLRAAAGDDALLIGEVYLPTDRLPPFLRALDVAFAFELVHAAWEPAAVREGIASVLGTSGDSAGWVCSNHDWPRMATRVGAANARAAALLLLTLPGTTFVFQGDEVGMGDGPGRGPGQAPDDRAGRDPHRHPMPWDHSAPHGGFTTAEPWLPSIATAAVDVAAQRADPRSLLHLYRDLIAARRDLRDPAEIVEAGDGVVAVRRGEYLVAASLWPEPVAAPTAGTVVRHTHDPAASGGPAPAVLVPGEGFLARAR